MQKTTVIIPNYNGLEYIDECLRTVFLSDTDIKVTVVDNGSTDGSYELIGEKYPQAEVIRFEENTGFCHACNAGIEKCDTPYVMLLNNDTKIEKDTVSKLERDLDTHPEALAFQAKMVRMDNPDIIDSAGDLFCLLGWAFALGKDRPSLHYSGIKPVFSGCGGACIYRKAVLDEIGYLDENHFAYLEDVDLGYRGRLKGYGSYVDLDATVLHKGSGFSGSRHNDFKVKLSARNGIYLIYKNMPPVQIILSLPFLLIGYLIKMVFFVKKGLGKAYFNGLGQGFKLCFSEKGRKNKVRLGIAGFASYFGLHMYMFINIFRRLG